MDQASVFDDADGESYQFNDDQVKDIKVYESIKTSCSVCNVGTLNKEGNPVTVVVYGRNGVCKSIQKMQFQEPRQSLQSWSLLRIQNLQRNTHL